MNIFVCIKQVPSTNKVQVDEKTGVLKRDGIASKMNPYDLYALETALRLKAEHGGTLTVGTMGPPQAQAVVKEAYMMGADEGYVFSDRRLGGADVLATSYTLSQAIQSVGDFDLILCGKQTTDGDTAQVGPAIAEHLGIPHAAWVSKLTTDLALSIGAKDMLLADTDERKESIWNARGAFLEAIKGSTPEMDECDVVVPREIIPAFVRKSVEIGKKLGVRICSFGHAGDGNLHIYACKDELRAEVWNDVVEKVMDEL